MPEGLRDTIQRYFTEGLGLATLFQTEKDMP
jgi:hypothetical protein